MATPSSDGPLPASEAPRPGRARRAHRRARQGDVECRLGRITVAARTLDLSRLGVRLEFLDPRMATPLEAARALAFASALHQRLQRGFEILFTPEDVRAQALLVRAELPRSAAEPLRYGCRFETPLSEDDCLRLGLDPVGECGPGATPPPADATELWGERVSWWERGRGSAPAPAPDTPAADAVTVSLEARGAPSGTCRAEGVLASVAGPVLTVRLPTADPAATAAGLGRDVRFVCVGRGRALWSAHGRVQRASGGCLMLVAESTPPAALRLALRASATALAAAPSGGAAAARVGAAQAAPSSEPARAATAPSAAILLLGGRRRGDRVAVAMPVDICPASTTPMEGMSVDLSCGGALLRITDPRLWRADERLTVMAFSTRAHTVFRDEFLVRFRRGDVAVKARLVRVVAPEREREVPLLAIAFDPPLDAAACHRLSIPAEGDHAGGPPPTAG